MKAPLSQKIKDILANKEYSHKLMQTIIDGARSGERRVNLNGKSVVLKRVGVKNGQ